jgi:hypothetical protein
MKIKYVEKTVFSILGEKNNWHIIGKPNCDSCVYFLHGKAALWIYVDDPVLLKEGEFWKLSESFL